MLQELEKTTNYNGIAYEEHVGNNLLIITETKTNVTSQVLHERRTFGFKDSQIIRSRLRKLYSHPTRNGLYREKIREHEKHDNKNKFVDNKPECMMAASLLRRDKKATAAHLKADLNRTDNSSGVRQLQELLDVVVNPEKPASDTEALDWCKCLIAGGEGFEEFCKTVRSYDNATLCGLVWTANFVAYRCRTCGISPCMSLCAECFNNGDHTGHDFNMFRSQAGGACDCGDSNVMRESG